MTRPITIALIGNPNCGKTVVFNALTGSRQQVGNWPGVTVEKKSGHYSYQHQTIEVVDLPGIYSTSVTDQETAVDALIASRFLVARKADVIVNVIDGSNLERNLYLTVQLIEMHLPIVLAVNMLDIVEKRGQQIDLTQLAKLLNCPVVGLIANRGSGIPELKKTIFAQAKNPSISGISIPWPTEINQAIDNLKGMQGEGWLALRLLENDLLAAQQVTPEIITTVKTLSVEIEKKLKEEPDILIADARYRFINQLTKKILSITQSKKITWTQQLDRIVLNRWLGIPIFLLVMYMMFVFAINVGGAFQDFFDISSDTLFVSGLAHLLSNWHFPPWLIAILANGIGKGINTTVTFIPILGGMFLFLALLEDSGYMARAAFVMDRLMNKMGLPGKSFVPMIVGFGCNVPAVMGARSLEHARDRILTVMMMPFMSCGARLAIFAVFASAFFSQGGQNIIFILYVLGILIAVLTGLLLRKTCLPGKPAPLIMELPPYHIPRIGSLLRQTWLRLKTFIVRAGKLIVPICMLLGVLNSISIHGKLVASSHEPSLLAQIGQTITPVFSPMGITQDNWPATMGLATGVLAKEVVVGTLNSLYSEVGNLANPAEEQFSIKKGLSDAVKSIPENLKGIGDAFKNPILAAEAPHHMDEAVFGIMVKHFDGKIGAFSYLLFILLYFPCISTLAVMRKEIGNGWANFSMIWSTGLAYALSVIAYQLLTIMRHPMSSFIWICCMLVLLGLVIFGINRVGNKNLGAAVASS